MEQTPREALATLRVVMASTDVDRHGDQLSKAELEEFSRQINERAPIPGFSEHNVGSPPVWQVDKAWVEEQNRKSLLCGTVTVWEQGILDQINAGKIGVSIGYMRNDRGTGESHLPVLRIDPNTFDSSELHAVLEAWRAAGINIETEEYFRKAQAPPAQLLLDATSIGLYIGGALAAGFIGFFGNKMAEKFCQGLGRLFRSAKGDSPAFIIQYEDVVDGRKVRIVVSIPYTNDEEFLNGYLFMPDELARLATRKLQSDTQAVYLRYFQGEHKWEIQESKF